VPDVRSGSNDLRQQGSVASRYQGHGENQTASSWLPKQHEPSPLISQIIREAIMPLNNLFRNLFAAYACAACGCDSGESEA